jgi:hypothetical protein
MNDAKTLMHELPLRAKLAVAVRCGQMALARVSARAVKRDRQLFEDGLQLCARVVERDDHGEEGALEGIGGRAVDVSQERSLSPADAKLLDAIAGACYAATSYSMWLASSPQRRDEEIVFVVANAARACRAALGFDSALDDDIREVCKRLERLASAEGWDDATPVALDRL